MTILFSDGFESGFSAWTGTTGLAGAVSVTSDWAHHGNYSFLTSEICNGETSAYYTFGSLQKTLHSRVYANVDVNLPNDKQIAINSHYTADINTAIAIAGIKKIAGINYWFIMYRDFGGWFTTYGPIANLNQTYCVELRSVMDNGAGEHVLYVDDTIVCEVSGLVNDDRGWIKRFCASGYSSINVYCDLYIDCCVASDSYIGTEVSNRPLMGVGLGCVSSP